MRFYFQAAHEHKLRHFLKWKWNMFIRSIMRPLHIRPWWDPEYEADIAKVRVETAELLAHIDRDNDLRRTSLEQAVRTFRGAGDRMFAAYLKELTILTPEKLRIIRGMRIALDTARKLEEMWASLSSF